MSNRAANPVCVLFFGLPYSGKTALIQYLAIRAPGETVFIDALFRDIVPAEEICLDRWLSEQSRFIDLVEDAVVRSDGEVIYIELGIFQRVYRTELIRRLSARDYRVIPLLLSCESLEEVSARQAKRQRELEQGVDKLKIAIGLEELYDRIYPVFEAPGPGEHFHVIDTRLPVSANVDTVLSLMKYPEDC